MSQNLGLTLSALPSRSDADHFKQASLDFGKILKEQNPGPDCFNPIGIARLGFMSRGNIGRRG
jgi:hypothetical protein